MANKNMIQEAIKMIETYDWTWRMSDSGYSWRYENAKASMRAFVKFVKTIDDAEVREALRNMWTLCFKDKREEYDTCKSELLNAYAA